MMQRSKPGKMLNIAHLKHLTQAAVFHWAAAVFNNSEQK
jgi:hypothetical protein